MIIFWGEQAIAVIKSNRNCKSTNKWITKRVGNVFNGAENNTVLFERPEILIYIDDIVVVQLLCAISCFEPIFLHAVWPGRSADRLTRVTFDRHGVANNLVDIATLSFAKWISTGLFHFASMQ